MMNALCPICASSHLSVFAAYEDWEQSVVNKPMGRTSKLEAMKKILPSYLKALDVVRNVTSFNSFPTLQRVQ